MKYYFTLILSLLLSLGAHAATKDNHEEPEASKTLVPMRHEQESTGSLFDSLPDEVVIEIFNFVVNNETSSEELSSLSAVCRRFNRCASHYPRTLTINPERMMEIVNKRNQFPFLFLRLDRIDSISIRGIEPNQMGSLAQALRYTPNLQVLDLYTSPIGDEGLNPLLSVFQYLTELRKLDLSATEITSLCLKALTRALPVLQKLQRLDVSHNEELMFPRELMDPLIEVLRQLPASPTLDVAGTLVDDEDIDWLDTQWSEIVLF